MLLIAMDIRTFALAPSPMSWRVIDARVWAYLFRAVHQHALEEAEDIFGALQECQPYIDTYRDSGTAEERTLATELQVFLEAAWLAVTTIREFQEVAEVQRDETATKIRDLLARYPSYISAKDVADQVKLPLDQVRGTLEALVHIGYATRLRTEEGSLYAYYDRKDHA